MKIGIMGGTFDPIHNGHLMLGRQAYEQFELDQVWFMPNGKPPHKSGEAVSAPIKERLEMVTTAIQGTQYFKLEDYEAKRSEVSYSYETMEYFKEAYPQHQFYFIIGADSLFSLEHWRRPERLMQLCTILAACRGEIDTEEKLKAQIVYLKQKYQAQIELLRAPLVLISSHEIRAALVDNETDTKLYLPPGIAQYIKEHELYNKVGQTL